MAVVIRPIAPGDRAAVGALTLAAYDAAGGAIEGGYRDFLADPSMREDGSTAVLVAELDGRVAGTVTFVVQGDAEYEDRQPPAGDCGFRVLAVDPAVEGRGVGAALIDRCLALARERGCHRMIITSMSWMTRAHGMYERRGFVRRPDLDVRFPGGVGVIFALDLTDEAAGRFPPPGPVPDDPPWYEDVWG